MISKFRNYNSSNSRKNPNPRNYQYCQINKINFKIMFVYNVHESVPDAILAAAFNKKVSTKKNDCGIYRALDPIAISHFPPLRWVLLCTNMWKEAMHHCRTLGIIPSCLKPINYLVLL